MTYSNVIHNLDIPWFLTPKQSQTFAL